MNLKSIIPLLAGLALCISLIGQNMDNAATGALENDDEQSALVKVATLDTVESNQEFQRNVQIVRTAYQNMLQTKAALEETSDESKKAELEEKLRELTADVNEKNQQMIKFYGFSLQRNYVLVIERSHIYMRVTPEEAARIQDKLDSAKDEAEVSE